MKLAKAYTVVLQVQLSEGAIAEFAIYTAGWTTSVLKASEWAKQLIGMHDKVHNCLIVGAYIDTVEYLTDGKPYEDRCPALYGDRCPSLLDELYQTDQGSPKTTQEK